MIRHGSRSIPLAAILLLILSEPAIAGPVASESLSWVLGRNSRPFMEFSYGSDWLRHKRLEAEFPSAGALELKAGYLSVEVLLDDVVELDDRFIHGAWYNTDLGSTSDGSAGMTGSLGRFGLGTRHGFGYDLKNAAVVPYLLTTMSWTELSTDRPPTLGQTDTDILNRYEGTFRFGHSAENGVRVNIGRTFSLLAGYEVAVVYPRFVFWEWLGSYAIAGAAHGVVVWFGRGILEESPVIGPILIFVSRAALTWGIYQLWREEMNWPFNSETPLTHETFKFGVNFTI
jgi:hypothetical protein